MTDSSDHQAEIGQKTCEVHVPGRDYASPWCAACQTTVQDWDAEGVLPPKPSGGDLVERLRRSFAQPVIPPGPTGPEAGR